MLLISVKKIKNAIEILAAIMDFVPQIMVKMKPFFNIEQDIF